MLFSVEQICLEVLKSTTPPELCRSLFILCYINCSNVTMLNLSVFHLTEILQIVDIFLDELLRLSDGNTDDISSFLSNSDNHRHESMETYSQTCLQRTPAIRFLSRVFAIAKCPLYRVLDFWAKKTRKIKMQNFFHMTGVNSIN